MTSRVTTLSVALVLSLLLNGVSIGFLVDKYYQRRMQMKNVFVHALPQDAQVMLNREREAKLHDIEPIKRRIADLGTRMIALMESEHYSDEALRDYLDQIAAAQDGVNRVKLELFAKVISTLSPEERRKMAQALQPVLSKHIMESTAEGEGGDGGDDGEYVAE